MRENLPAYYEQILKEKMERVAANEADIQVSAFTNMNLCRFLTVVDTGATGFKKSGPRAEII